MYAYIVVYYCLLLLSLPPEERSRISLNILRCVSSFYYSLKRTATISLTAVILMKNNCEEEGKLEKSCTFTNDNKLHHHAALEAVYAAYYILLPVQLITRRSCVGCPF